LHARGDESTPVTAGATAAPGGGALRGAGALRGGVRDPAAGVVAKARRGGSGPAGGGIHPKRDKWSLLAFLRVPTDALALSAQVLAGFRNTLRDNRFVSAAVKVS
jgi:hypothetical protein